MAKICIDPGHGGSDSGACVNGLRECELALAVSMKLRDIVMQAGHEVVMTRDTDVDVSFPDASATEELQARCNVSNDFGADVFVSIHCNAAENSMAHGTETFYCAWSNSGWELAHGIHSRMIGLGVSDRGIKSNPLYVTRMTNAVAVLVELAFLSNEGEAMLLASEYWQQQAAGAIAGGIFEYVGTSSL